MTEYERRLQATFATHTADELRRLAADLPVARLRRTDPAGSRPAATPPGCRCACTSPRT